MRKYLLLSLFIYLFVLFSFAQDTRLSGLEEELEQLLDDWHAPGFAVAVVDKDKVIFAQGFGFRDIENQLPATENTLFAIGSCSKAFTSAVLGTLESEGKLSFEDLPAKHIPELKFFSEDMDDQITIMDLMCHRTGLPRHDFSWYYFPTTSRAELVERIQYQEPTAAVRETWQYNNFMFLLQGVIGEKIRNKTWEENIRELFFQPLKMNTTNASIDELEAAGEPAIGYVNVQDSIIKKTDYYRIRGMAPAGSINSSVKEMANWVQCWIHGGKFDTLQVIPTSYVKNAMSSHMVIGGGLPADDHPDLHMSTYGLGWFNSSYKGHYRVQHGGNIDGFSANTCFFPTDSIGIVVLTNQGGSAIPSIARNIVADRMLGLERTDWSAELLADVQKNREQQKEAMEAKDSTEENEIGPIRNNLMDYVGSFQHKGYGTVQITTSNDSLFGSTPHVNFWLKHKTYDIFSTYDITEEGIDTTEGLPIRFSMNDKADINSLYVNLQPGLDPLEFSRIHEKKELSQKVLERYVGNFELSGVVMKIFTKGNELHLLVPAQPEYTLASIGEDEFTIVGLDGYDLEFELNEKGDVIAVVFDQPNGRFRAIKKE